MTATKYTTFERAIEFALLAAGLSVAVIGLLDLLGWALDIPLLTLWKVGSRPMSPSAAVLSIFFGTALCLSAQIPQGRAASSLITLFGVAGSISALLLLALRISGVYLPAEHLGLGITGTFNGLPLGYISPITALCLLLSFGSLLASLPYGIRSSWRGRLLMGFGGLVSLVSFFLLLAYAFGIPLIFSKTIITPALNTSLSLLIMGLAQLMLAARYPKRPAASPDDYATRRFPFALALIVLVAGIFVTAYHFFRENELKFRQELESQLLAVTDLKTGDLARWRMERLADARLTQNTGFTAAVRQFLETPHSVSAQQEMQNLLSKYSRTVGYERAFLLDAKGVTRMSEPPTAEIPAAIVAESAAASLRTGKIMLQDFYRDEHDQRVYLALIVPILDKQDGNLPLGVVVLRIDPSAYLYPLIKHWLTPYASVETVLIRREDNDVLFLNDLRFRANAPLALRLSLTANSGLIATKSMLGQQGIVEGLDYQGVSAIAAVRAIPDSPWYLETRIDAEELYGPLRKQMWLSLSLISAWLCAAGVMLILLWRKQSIAFYQKSYRYSRSLIETSLDPLVTISPQGIITDVNASTEVVTGMPRDALIGTKFANYFTEPSLAMEGYQQVFQTGFVRDYELTIRHLDGHQTPVLFNASVYRDESGNVAGVFAAARDVTLIKIAEQELRESQELFSLFMRYSPVYVYIKEITPTGSRVLQASDNFQQMIGISGRDMIGKSMSELFPEDIAAKINADDCAVITHGGVLNLDEDFNGRNYNTIKFPIVLGDKTLLAGYSIDITERKEAEARLKLAASVFIHAGEGIVITDAAGIIIDVNAAFTHVTGYTREEVLGRNPRIFKSGRHEAEFYAALWQALTVKGHWYGEIWNRRKNGEIYAEMINISAVQDTHGQTQNYVALFSDITPLKDHQQELERLAHYDALTRLPNRTLLADRLRQAMAQMQRRGRSLAVAYLDLDGFKTVNDGHGHVAGDQLLITLAQQMKASLREVDTLARIGGDEFVAVLVDLKRPQDCEPLLERLLLAASGSVMVSETLLNVSTSIGVTFYPQDDADAEQLLRHADQAMYSAKQSGKNRYRLFDVNQDIATKTWQEDLADIRSALERHEFVLHYQPKVNMKTGAVIGAEALIRWQHPEQGLLLPAAFLPIIIDHAFSVELGEWVIDTAFAQLAEWQALGLEIPVSVNIDAYHLQQDGFALRLRERFSANPAVRPGHFELEILESSALEDVNNASNIMQACCDIGVHFALDDFGTGYSSLSHLKYLPVDVLKIDQSFIRDMMNDTNDLSIVEGVIGLAGAFHRQVIAEGVETAGQGELLMALGCDLAQGFAIAPAMPGIELPGWAAGWHQHAAWAV